MATASFNTRRIVAGAWLMLFLILDSGSAIANVGPPWTRGDLAAEPVGIKDVEITHETLTIDLRPLARNEPVQVEAIYQLHNRGDRKKLDLLFASGSPTVTDFKVWLGETPVASQAVQDVPLPESWKTPKRTPGIQGQKDLEYVVHKAASIPFTVEIPAGPHALKVRYSTKAATHFVGSPTICHQFAYVLAPARSWSGFGGLDAMVFLPDGWDASCTPAMTREGDLLKGTFAELPADAIAITVQAPEGPRYRPVSAGTLALFWVMVCNGIVFCFLVGRSKGRRLARLEAGQPSWLQQHAWPLSLTAGMAWGLVVFATGLLAVFAPDWMLPAGQVSRYGYGQILAILGVVLMTVLVLPVGFAISQVTAVRTQRRTMEKERTVALPPEVVTRANVPE